MNNLLRYRVVFYHFNKLFISFWDLFLLLSSNVAFALFTINYRILGSLVINNNTNNTHFKTSKTPSLGATNVYPNALLCRYNAYNFWIFQVLVHKHKKWESSRKSRKFITSMNETKCLATIQTRILTLHPHQRYYALLLTCATAR